MIEFKSATLSKLGAKPTAERRAVGFDLREDWPAGLRGAGWDAGAPTAWSAEGLLQYLPPEAQDRLLDDVTALSAVNSTIAADFDAGSETADEADVSAITQNWQQRGFSLDMPSLMFTGERNDVREYLGAQGWRVTGSPVTELVTQHGLATTRIMGPLATTVYLTGTREDA